MTRLTCIPRGGTIVNMSNMINRINRLEGQLASVKKLIEAGTPCSEVVPQLLATKGAFSSLVNEYLTQSLQVCTDTMDEKTMRQLIKMITRHI